MKGKKVSEAKIALEPVWGAKAIAVEIKAPLRKTFYMLERGMLPARKVGARWVAERGGLREFFTGSEAQPEM
jgi:hypothetical protein